MKTSIIKYAKLYAIGILLVLTKCDSCIDPPKVTKIETTTVSEITAATAKAGLKFVDLSGNVTEFGHCWNTGGNPTISNSRSTISATADIKEFFSDLTGLSEKTTYFVRAYFIENGEPQYGNEIEFTTIEKKAISIISPAANEIWGLGIADTIKWNDNIDENLKIELYKGGNKLPDIATSTESDGIYEWTPQNLSNGTDYSIKIISVNDPNISVTSGNFSITVAPSISIIQPPTGTTWIKGSSNLIEWTDNLSENVKIELLKAGVYNSDIVLDAPNQTYSWIIPRSLGTGGDYSIKISSKTNSSIFNTSGLFTIKEIIPTVSTAAISSITKTSATSGGNVTNDGGASVDARGVCYRTTSNPTILNSVTVNGSGTGAFTSPITGLTPGTKYYLRAYAHNSAGTGYGEEIEFTTNSETQTPPTAAIAPATEIKNASATLNGAVNANGNSTTVSFEFGPTNLYGSVIDAAPGNVTGSTTTNVSAALTGLVPGALYHFRVKAVNIEGTVYSDDQTFTTTQFPVASTLAASSITTTSATLNGSVNATNLSTTVTFEYGLDISYGSSISATPSPVTGSTEIAISAGLSGLQPGTIYHYRTKAVSAGGTTYGDDKSFTTLCSEPTATTTDATNITSSSATLNGNVNANNFSTSVSFEYGESTSYGNTVNATPSPVSGNTVTPVNAGITGLLAGKLYHYRVKTVSCGGTIYGIDKTFNTCAPPTATANAATNITNIAATLNGTVNANGFSTTVTFEYGTTTAYGNIVNASPNTATGSSNTAVSAGISGLTPGTLYHYRMKTVNCAGTFSSEDFTFTTYHITITSPTSSDHWVGSETHAVTWNDNITENVSIALYKNSVLIQTIVNSTSSNGLYNWVVPSNLPYSGDFSIRITSINNSNISTNSQLFKISEPTGTVGTVTDIESNAYSTIKIGTQWWMKENLKATKYKNNTSIPLVTDAASWSALTTPGFCWYNNDATTYKATYGALYNWYTVNTGNLCPSGWHVPSDVEWTIMENYLISNGYNYDGTTTGNKIAKSLASTTLWTASTVTGAVGNTDYPTYRNKSGFTALPGGLRVYNGSFGSISGFCYLWSSNEYGAAAAWDRDLSFNTNSTRRYDADKGYGFSVRCLKD